MDSFLRRAFPPAMEKSHNATEHATLNVSEDVFSAFIPGYSIISHFARNLLGIDIGVFLTLGAILMLASRGIDYVMYKVVSIFEDLFLSTVYIDESDYLFSMLMGWLQATGSRATTHNRNLNASTVSGITVEDPDAEAKSAQEALTPDGLFDYRKWRARDQPSYQPAYGRHVFWHKGLPFLMTRKQHTSTKYSSRYNYGSAAQEDYLKLDCLGRTTALTKALLRDIKLWMVERPGRTTSISHPHAERLDYWKRTAERASRPMDTVILAAEEKAAIVADINEFLHPRSVGWYARRGIPYRRGYLFHGPPGTGKTSLSFALAGLFGLDVYAISLQEPEMTEGTLMSLLTNLPRRCVVLLEDVDAAGLEMRKETKVKTRTEEATAQSEEPAKPGAFARVWQPVSWTICLPWSIYATIRAFCRQTGKFFRNFSKFLNIVIAEEGSPASADGGSTQAPPAGKARSSISLSGLLNAIDGVASHEGRVLIMTTNHADKLDPALVRPGRVDRKVEFKLATRSEVEELFVRMYCVDDNPSNGNAADAKAKSVTAAVGGAKQQDPDIAALAVEFAAHVPDNTFTPAEIQNHMMKYKNKPRQAVEAAEKWKTDLLEAKKETKGQTAGDEAKKKTDGQSAGDNAKSSSK